VYEKTAKTLYVHVRTSPIVQGDGADGMAVQPDHYI